jgi:hypothetical protein
MGWPELSDAFPSHVFEHREERRGHVVSKHRMAQTCRRLAARDMRRVRPPGNEGADWTDFFQGGGTIEAFDALLTGAPRLEYRLEEARPNRPLDEESAPPWETK